MEWTAELHCDTVEWCPTSKDLLVVGCYQLEEEQDSKNFGKRKGALVTLRATNSLEAVSILYLEAGVLDCRWISKSERPLLVTASASKTAISIYELDGEAKLLEKHKWEGADGIALSCEWSTLRDLGVVCSNSNGEVTFMHLASTGLTVINHHAEAHAHEAWTAATHATDANIYFSGGDDCKLQMYDLRSASPVMANKKSHTMGVTSLEHHGFHSLISGSYDERLRLWDTRSFKNEVSSQDTGGGVWRIKRHNDWLGVARMHAGFAIIPTSTLCLEQSDYCTLGVMPESKIIPVPPTNLQKSLGYGFSWSSSTPTRIATCSFYDNKVAVTELDKVIFQPEKYN